VLLLLLAGRAELGGDAARAILLLLLLLLLCCLHGDLDQRQRADALSRVQGILHKLSDGGVQALAWLHKRSRQL